MWRERMAEIKKEKGISTRVINIHTIKPIDKDIIIDAAKKTGCIVTAEEHNIIGGLGSAVAEAVCESGKTVPVVRVGVNDVFGKYGNHTKTRRKTHPKNSTRTTNSNGSSHTRQISRTDTAGKRYGKGLEWRDMTLARSSLSLGRVGQLSEHLLEHSKLHKSATNGEI